MNCLSFGLPDKKKRGPHCPNSHNHDLKVWEIEILQKGPTKALGVKNILKNSNINIAPNMKVPAVNYNYNSS